MFGFVRHLFFVTSWLLLVCVFSYVCGCRANILFKQRDRNFPVGETGRSGWQYVNSSVLTHSCQTSRFSSAIVMATGEHHPQQGRGAQAAWR